MHDGFEGQPEVDFQQSMALSANWNGFFDKESGVWFYMYGFAETCLTADELTPEAPASGVFSHLLMLTFDPSVISCKCVGYDMGEILYFNEIFYTFSNTERVLDCESKTVTSIKKTGYP